MKALGSSFTSAITFSYPRRRSDNSHNGSRMFFNPRILQRGSLLNSKRSCGVVRMGNLMVGEEDERRQAKGMTAASKRSGPLAWVRGSILILISGIANTANFGALSKKITNFVMDMELSFTLLLLMLLISNLLLQSSNALSLQSNEELKEFKVETAEKNYLVRTRPRNEFFHPLTGLCVLTEALTDPVKLGPCARSDAWSYTPQKFLVVKGTYNCLQATGVGQPVKLSIICTTSDSQWLMETYAEKSHFSIKLADGTKVCLDVDGSDMVVSNPCNGFDSSGTSNADSQWFKFVTVYK